jgi:hypothetical protein
MTAIVEKELVHAPLASADRFLKAFLADHPTTNGEGARVFLHAGDTAQPAIVSLQLAHRPEDMTPRYKVHWEAEGGGPYPVFDGELTVGADEDYDSFWLVIDGGYAPPLGIAGQMFDSVIGRRIATASARGLLAEMRKAIEVRFAAQELAKRS